MKAIVYTEYGPSEVLHLGEVEKPNPKDDEVLIRVYASTITPSDGLMRSGKSWIGRIISGPRKPRGKYKILGIGSLGKLKQ